MTIKTYLEKYRDELIQLFGTIYSAREIELVINEKLSKENFDRSIAYDAVNVHKYNDSVIDFPIKNRERMTKLDELLSMELFSLIMCEEAVKSGELVRKGLKYKPANIDSFKKELKYGKYIVYK